jgi:hypothetical protein
MQGIARGSTDFGLGAFAPEQLDQQVPYLALFEASGNALWSMPAPPLANLSAAFDRDGAIVIAGYGADPFSLANESFTGSARA